MSVTGLAARLRRSNTRNLNARSLKPRSLKPRDAKPGPSIRQIALIGALAATVLMPALAFAWDTNAFSTSDEELLVQLTNQARVDNGLGSLRVDSVLTSVARWRSQDMIDRNYMSHDIPPDGTKWFDELKRLGYCYVVTGENIGKNNYPDDVATQTILDGFMGSPEHRANILGVTYTAIGVGAYKGSDGTHAWTEIFAQPCVADTATPAPATAGPTVPPAVTDPPSPPTTPTPTTAPATPGLATPTPAAPGPTGTPAAPEPVTSTPTPAPATLPPATLPPAAATPRPSAAVGVTQGPPRPSPRPALVSTTVPAATPSPMTVPTPTAGPPQSTQGPKSFGKSPRGGGIAWSRPRAAALGATFTGFQVLDPFVSSGFMNSLESNLAGLYFGP
jgi:uncharacterized protein YkwD